MPDEPNPEPTFTVTWSGDGYVSQGTAPDPPEPPEDEEDQP
jgi:hypothetical protein